MKNVLRLRFYPDPVLAGLLARTFGCVRVAGNDAVESIRKAVENKTKIPAYKELSSALTASKKREDRVWMNEVSSVPLQQKLRHLTRAVKNFRAKKGGLPSFLSKHDNQSAEFTKSAFRFDKDKRELRLAKHELPLKIVWSKTLPKDAEISTVTVTLDKAGRYHLAMVFKDDPARHLLPKQKEGEELWLGADIGLGEDAFLIVSRSDGTRERIPAPLPLKKLSGRLAVLQQALAKKAKGSSRWNATKRKIARLYARMTDIRNDFLHKLSTRLVRENQAICLETLGIKEMMEGKQASKLKNRAWHDVSAFRFKSMVEYKAARSGRLFVPAPKYEPSTRECSVCHTVRGALPLHVRRWTCSCGAVHDRDDNAADNLRELARIALFASKAKERVLRPC